jgi:hypothetical protein
VFANAGHSLEQSVLTASDFFGEFMELFLQGSDLGVEVPDHGQFVFERDLTQGMIFGRQEFGFPGIAIGAALADGRPVVG